MSRERIMKQPPVNTNTESIELEQTIRKSDSLKHTIMIIIDDDPSSAVVCSGNICR